MWEKISRYRCLECGRVSEYDSIPCGCKALHITNSQEFYTSLAASYMRHTKQNLRDEISKMIGTMCSRKADRELVVIGMSPDAQAKLLELDSAIEDLRLCIEVAKEVIKCL